MTIETKIAKNGRINAKVNGKCVAINTLSELVAKSLRNNEQVELIASDGHKFTCTGYDFYEFAHPLCRRYSFNFMDDAGNTFPAYTMTEAIYTVDKFASGEYKTRNIFAEYAVTAEAMDIATEAEIENAQANDVKFTEQDNSNVTIDDGKIFDSAKVTIEQAVNIISRLNYRNDTFQYRFTTREDNADIKYRHFDAYRDNGEKDGFAIIEIVVNGKLEIVRFFNLFRDITVDLKLGDFTPDYSRYDQIINVDIDANEEIKFCYKTNRGNVRELKISETNWSDNEVNPLENKYFRMYHPDACANEEIINCTDDIIITDDAYTQMIRAELANAQIASGNYDIKINGERVYFSNHKITRIDAEDKLGFSFEYTLQGRKQFRHNGRVISRERIIQIAENREIAKAQGKSFREFFINPDAPKHGFFQVQISPTFADGKEHNYSRAFEYYDDAINFVNNAIDFCGDVPTHITIKRDKQAGQIYYHRTPDGSVHLDKPDTDFFKYYSAEEIQARIDAINKAIHFNRVFYKNIDSDIDTEGLIAEANFNLEVTRNFYEFVLRANAPITNVETDGSEEDDDDNEVFNLLPSVDELNDVDLTKSAYFDGRADLGYIFKLSVAINRSFDGTRPWTLESIDGNITVEGRTWQDYAKFIITDTDGTEDDDFADEIPALFPAEDGDDDELIDPPATTPADDFEAKLAELKAKQDAAKEKELAAKKVYKEASDKYEECRAATQDFLDAHAEKLTEKIKAIELESYITMVRNNGKERCDVFSTDELYVDAFNAFGEMFIVRCRGNELGTYDTPAQIEVVINQLKAAIERGDREFTFPTIEELTKPEVNKDATADSLTRAMKIALEHYQDFCRVGNLTAATNEWSLYKICRKAMTKLWKGEAA